MIHEALVDLFRARPHLAAELLAAVQLLAPDSEVEGTFLEADLSQVTAPEYAADAVIRLRGSLDLLLILEVQLRKDPKKLRTWPAYLGVAWARHDCPVALLVIARSRATALWAARPIQIGPGSVVTPIVIGPDQVPVITDPMIARDNPEIAVLSAMVHGHDAQALEIGRAAVQATLGLDEKRARLYLDLVLDSLETTARALLESLMNMNLGHVDAWLKRRDAAMEVRGRAEAGREILLRQLHRRFGEVPEDIKAQVELADGTQIGKWAEDLMFAGSLEALFGPAPR